MSCHAVSAPGDQASSRLAEIVLVGHPNVGKSVLFGRLTGRHVTPGSQVTIVTLENLPVREREQLLAHGVAPGRVVDVLQIRPVTIVRVEHAELAFETTLSRAIGITRLPEGGPR